MKMHTFCGGTHVNYEKEVSRYFKIKEIIPPAILIIPMNQHAGTPAKPIVKVGEKIAKGQKIAEGDAHIHSPASGIVKGIRPNMHPNGTASECIIIENDFADTLYQRPRNLGDLEVLSSQAIIDSIREAGIVGVGGIPTHIKLRNHAGKRTKHCIINGAESDPFLTADHRMILEYPEKIIHGCLAVMRVTGAEKGYIAIENNKPDAIEGMRQYLKNNHNINVCPLEAKYPQGSEKQLINAVLGTKKQGAAIVHNVATVAAISDCITSGMPQTHRIITVCGEAFETAQNYLIPIGTTLRHIVKEHGGFKQKPERVLVGGAMLGMAQCTLDVPITKDTSAVLALTPQQTAKSKPSPCLRCGRCVTSCPARIRPVCIAKLAKTMDREQVAAYNVADCIECGTCSYVCPAKIHLLEHIKTAKGKGGI